MAKPLVAIVGRPNVGKSMLFNKLTGRRTSIVEDTPGVTRDRIYGECEWCGRSFSLVDTGGIEPGTDSDMLKFMRRQAEIGIELADCIIMVTDVHSGVTAADEDVATMLRKSGKPVALAVNKSDSVGPVNPDVYEFYTLGIGDLFETSAVHGHGTGDLLDWVLENIPEDNEDEEESAAGDDFLKQVNPDSLKIINGYAEPWLANAKVGDSFQFMRMAYFCKDKDSTDERAVFNRVVVMKDGFRLE